MGRYSAWRSARFNVSLPEKVNQSRRLFTQDSANEADRKIVESLIDHDLVLYEVCRNTSR